MSESSNSPKPRDIQFILMWKETATREYLMSSKNDRNDESKYKMTFPSALWGPTRLKVRLRARTWFQGLGNALTAVCLCAVAAAEAAIPAAAVAAAAGRTAAAAAWAFPSPCPRPPRPPPSQVTRRRTGSFYVLRVQTLTLFILLLLV